MKPIEVQFKDIKNALESIEITLGPLLTDVSQMYDPPEPEADYQTIDCLVVFSTKASIFSLLDKFHLVREEISSNLSMPIEVSIKREYLSRIFIYYSDLESRIDEDERGNLTCNFIHFYNKSYNELIEFHQNIFDCFLDKLRSELREEVSYIDKLLNTMKKKPEIPFPQNRTIQKNNIEWKRGKNDLIVLVRALKLLGAINNSTSNLTFTQAYKFFGDLFNIELKNPEDQLRQVSDSLDTLCFLEELLSKYNEDQAFLRRKRNS